MLLALAKGFRRRGGVISLIFTFFGGSLAETFGDFCDFYGESWTTIVDLGDLHFGSLQIATSGLGGSFIKRSYQVGSEAVASFKSRAFAYKLRMQFIDLVF